MSAGKYGGVAPWGQRGGFYGNMAPGAGWKVPSFEEVRTGVAQLLGREESASSSADLTLMNQGLDPGPMAPPAVVEGGEGVPAKRNWAPWVIGGVVIAGLLYATR